MQRLGPTRTRLPGDAPLEFIENHVSIPADLEFSRELDRFLPKPNVEEEQKKMWVAHDKSILKYYHILTYSMAFVVMPCGKQRTKIEKVSLRRWKPSKRNWLKRTHL